MESLALYGTAAWWRMKRQDPSPDLSSPDASESGQAPPRAAFEPPVRDPGVLALLKGLNPPEEPVPTETAVTDGELSASFAAGPRAAPAPLELPPPEASVVIGPDKPAPKKKPAPEKIDTTFRLRPASPSLAVPLLLALLVVGGGAGVWLWSHPSGSPSPAASAPLSPPRATVAPPSRFPPPPPVETAAAATPPVTSEPTAAPDPARPAAAASSASALPVKPAQSVPRRRKEDEPDRVL